MLILISGEVKQSCIFFCFVKLDVVKPMRKLFEDPGRRNPVTAGIINGVAARHLVSSIILHSTTEPRQTMTSTYIVQMAASLVPRKMKPFTLAVPN